MARANEYARVLGMLVDYYRDWRSVIPQPKLERIAQAAVTALKEAKQ